MNFKLERAKKEEFSSVTELIAAVYDNLAPERKSWFVINPEEDLRLLEQGDSWAYVAREEETGALAAIFTVAFPGDSSGNLGRDCGLTGAELLKTVHMDTAAVLPEYRGYGLQKRLMELGEADLREAGYRYLCCTVHPDNQYSKQNVLKQGYRIMTTKEKYNGFLRHVFLKKL